MKFAHVFIDRPIFAGVISIAGALAVFTLPIAQYPEIAPPTIQVATNHTGASASVVADTVASPIEQAGQPPTYFEIAGSDGSFFPAQAEIEGGNRVVVSSPQVSKPEAARFGWNEAAQPNLANVEGWPALPFRSNGPEWNPGPVKQ